METKNISDNSSEAVTKRSQNGAESGFYFKNAPVEKTADINVKDDDFIMTDILLTRSRRSRTGSIPVVKPASGMPSSEKVPSDPSMWVVTLVEKRNMSKPGKERVIPDAGKTDDEISSETAKVTIPAFTVVLDRDEYEEDSVDVSGFFSKRSQEKAGKLNKTVSSQPVSGTFRRKIVKREAAEVPDAEKSTFFESDGVKKRSVGKYIGRGFIAFGAFLGILLVSAYAALYLVANGPSPTVRNMLVISAKQASATKWMPSLFLSDDEVEQIMADSSKVNVDIMSAEEYAKLHSTEINDPDSGETADEWANTADEGIKLVVENGATFKAYVLFVKDPSRIFVGVSSEDFDNATVGMNVFKMTEKYDALAGINGGEFLDKGGMGTGAKPMGMTYSLGECVWDAASQKTFIGFDSNNKLVVREGMDKATATALGIRDGVSFQTGNVLIDSSDGNVKLNYVESNTGVAQRTAIGQREDGTVIMIVTDGRTASSIGATYNDIIDMMVSYGAVNAAMLDGGSSAMLYYENYYDKYSFDKAALDEYQLQGLVNKYKAFTSPRHIPTYFLVKKEAS